MEWTKIVMAILMVMMLVFMWPAYKYWSKNSPKAQDGDWKAAGLAFGGVALFLVLLILSVR